MIVLSVPIRLRIAASALLISIPLVAFEVIIINRSPIWNLPYRSMGYWSLAFTLICIPLSAWLIGAKKWAFPVSALLASVWILISSWIAYKTSNPSLAFFTLFLLGFFSFELLWVKTELERSFFDPQLAWYQGLPKPIPGLTCKVSSGEKAIQLRVSRIDHDGVIVFSQAAETKESVSLSSFLDQKKIEMTFSFRDRQVDCIGVPTLAMSRGIGAGIQFLGASSDQKKEIGDFVEFLRGEGYVS